MYSPFLLPLSRLKLAHPCMSTGIVSQRCAGCRVQPGGGLVPPSERACDRAFPGSSGASDGSGSDAPEAPSQYSTEVSAPSLPPGGPAGLHTAACLLHFLSSPRRVLPPLWRYLYLTAVCSGFPCRKQAAERPGCGRAGTLCLSCTGVARCNACCEPDPSPQTHPPAPFPLTFTLRRPSPHSTTASISGCWYVYLTNAYGTGWQQHADPLLGFFRGLLEPPTNIIFSVPALHVCCGLSVGAAGLQNLRTSHDPLVWLAWVGAARMANADGGSHFCQYQNVRQQDDFSCMSSPYAVTFHCS